MIPYFLLIMLILMKSTKTLCKARGCRLEYSYKNHLFGEDFRA